VDAETWVGKCIVPILAVAALLGSVWWVIVEGSMKNGMACCLRVDRARSSTILVPFIPRFRRAARDKAWTAVTEMSPEMGDSRQEGIAQVHVRMASECNRKDTFTLTYNNYPRPFFFTHFPSLFFF